MFSDETRARVRTMLIERAEDDPRIVAAAAVGSSAVGGDRWSDLDLTFAVVDSETVVSVLDAWTREMVATHQAVVLFDVPVDRTIYRVFLLPGMLQVDLSFTPAVDFRPRSARFRLLFGEAGAPLPITPHAAEDELGYGIHHLMRAHISIERGRPWQAEYWIHAARDVALTLACRRYGLDTSYARGFDELPGEVHAGLRGALPGDLSDACLRRALGIITAGLLREAEGVARDLDRVRRNLTDLITENHA